MPPPPPPAPTPEDDTSVDGTDSDDDDDDDDDDDEDEFPTPTPDEDNPDTNGDGFISAEESAAAAEDDSVCFPADATVELASGERVAMADLAIGDVVRVAAGADAAAWSPVYFFSHKDPAGAATTARAYVTLTTASGAALTLTPGHYVMADGVATAAAEVAVGQALSLASGAASAVTASTRSVRRGGLYNPHTLAGTIVVDGVVASTYTTAVHPAVAAGLLAPLRAAWRAAGLSVGGKWLHAGGVGRSAAVAMLPSGPSVCAA